MTENGGFKRAVRREARASGRRYTEALAELQRRPIAPFADARPYDVDELRQHLERTRGDRVTSLAPIDDDPATRPRGSWPGHYPSTLVARHAGGASTVVRVFTSSADTLQRVEGDAEILRFLATHGYPAERLAAQHPVTAFGGGAVLVTELLPGARPTDADGRVESPRVSRELGSLLGRLHTLPAAAGAVARDGGAEEHDGGFHVGRPGQDLAAAMRFLVDVEDRIPTDGRDAFETLRDALEQADDAEGLPEALTHGNFHPWAAVGRPGALSIVGWAGSGRGPRLPAFAWLLATAAEAGVEHIDEVAAGYREHVRPTDEELERLPDVLRIRPLWLACLDYREAVRGGRPPRHGDGWTPPWAVDRAGRSRDRGAGDASAVVVGLMTRDVRSSSRLSPWPTPSAT